MAVDSEYMVWAGLLAVAFLPAFIYALYIRSIEKYEPEPWRKIIMAFAWGAIVGVVFTFAFKVFALGNGDILAVKREYEYAIAGNALMTVFLVGFLFPVFGEFLKLLGNFTVKKEVTEVEDGVIYGAVMGLGFAASANVFYLYVSLRTGGIGAAAPIVLSSISNMLLHASASGVAGYGLGRMLVKRELVAPIIFMLAGIFIHSSFNMLSFASLMAKETFGYWTYIGSLVAILIISNLVFKTIRARMLKLIKILDHESQFGERPPEEEPTKE